jgi:hypothetical protein
VDDGKRHFPSVSNLSLYAINSKYCICLLIYGIPRWGRWRSNEEKKSAWTDDESIAMLLTPRAGWAKWSSRCIDDALYKAASSGRTSTVALLLPAAKRNGSRVIERVAGRGESATAVRQMLDGGSEVSLGLITYVLGNLPKSCNHKLSVVINNSMY